MNRGAPRCTIYHATRDGKPITDLASISDQISEPGVLVWFDVVGPRPDDLEVIREEFDLHPLAIEDAIKAHERAKIESYGTYLFLVVHAVSLAADELQVHEVAIFAGAKFIVTVRAWPEFPFDEVEKCWHERRNGLKMDGAALLYTILDTIVDGYSPVVARFEERIDALEATFARERQISDEAMLRISKLKRNLGSFRRAILPMREILAYPIRGEDNFFVRADIPYFRDVHDHVLLAIDQAEWTRDLVNNTVETQLSIASNRQNEVAKQLTVIATIFLPLTFITGFFGQNFGVMVDWIKTGSSFLVFGIGTEVATVAALVVLFKKRGWF